MVEFLVSSPRLAGLEELNLSRNRIRTRGAEALARSPHLENLLRLGLRNTAIAGSGANALVQSRSLEGLEVLDVWDSHLSGPTLRRLTARFGQVLWLHPLEPPCWSRG
jgi:hypothetical protein